jgi:hypothetical protein
LTLRAIARAHGAVFQNGRFQVACPTEDAVRDAVFAVSQCVSLAMVDIVTHEPTVEDEALSSRVARTLAAWPAELRPDSPSLKVEGKMGVQHTFDFVTTPVREDANTVAIKILHPSIGPHIQAERYGFLAYDIQGTDAGNWPRLAIVAKAEEWSERSLKLVESISKQVILLQSDHEDRVETVLPGRMTALTEAA